MNSKRFKKGDIVELRRDLPARIVDYYSSFAVGVDDTLTVVKEFIPELLIHGNLVAAVGAKINGAELPYLYFATDDITPSYGECLKKILE